MRSGIWGSEMESKKKTIQWRRVLPLEIIVGLLLLVGTFTIASQEDISTAEQRLFNMVECIKEQCNASQLRGLASEGKSLLRMTESVELVRWRMVHDTQAEKDLVSYAADAYVDGLILLDTEGNIVQQSGPEDFSAEELLAQVNWDALLDVIGFTEKVYAVRFGEDDEAHVDLAAVGRMDAPGVLVGYYRTSEEYAHTFNNAIQMMVSGYEPEHDGIIVISSGDRIVASNNEALVGGSVEDVRILKRVMERGSGSKLVCASGEGSSVGHDFGLMDRSQSYNIYAYMTEREVFSTTPKNLLCTLVIYSLVLVAIHMLWWRAERGYREKQVAEQKRYTEMLQSKNEQVREAVEQARKANAAKSNFLSRMSHDIRTPLNGIIGLLKIDEAHYDDMALIRNNHEKMEVAANHLQALINDILQMSKLEDGAVTLTHERLSLLTLTEEIAIIVGERASEAGVSWEFDPASKLPYPDVYGSPLHLRQVFLNIYSNCIKYNKAGGRICSSVRCLGVEDSVVTYRWTITDTGIGMSQEYLAHIFEPFTQERVDARSVYHGTGLGMTITKGLIDQMGGTIEVSSREGEGSTFVITLPFQLAEAPAEGAAAETETAGQASIRGLRLLLAEDNALNAEIAKVLLEDEGAEITVAGDGQQAVTLFSESPAGTFDAILMDVMMPVMDGLTATRTIRAMERPDAGTIPIIALTANAFAEDAEACFRAGMNAHLAKPLEIKKVVAAIAGCCGGEGRTET